MKIVTIIGARPQFIKAATVTRAIKKSSNIKEIIVHTGQHYDDNMSTIFFDELNIPKPDYNLNVGSASHAYQTALMMQKLEDLLIVTKPDLVLVYGDTNSTLAGSVTAAKLHIPIAHVEAGLRSFNKKMPEEINRIVTDHIADLLFAPTQNALDLLKKEGLEAKSYFVGDVMLDSVIYYKEQLRTHKNLPDLPDNFYLATVHRAENTDQKHILKEIFEAFAELDLPIIIPAHPRTIKFLNRYKIIPENVKIIEPIGYLDMLNLISKSNKVLTDSGGLQKEAYFLKKQCITLREETEWVETLEENWNQVIGKITKERISKAVYSEVESKNQKEFFGKGNSAEIIVEHLLKF